MPIHCRSCLLNTTLSVDRALNHMSDTFGDVMRDLGGTMKRAYNCHSAIMIPGSGTFAMEAVARQFAHDKNCLVVRNGFFSFRWTQILDQVVYCVLNVMQ
jgi:aspartate aminotransferase-like enzyme